MVCSSVDDVRVRRLLGVGAEATGAAPGRLGAEPGGPGIGVCARVATAAVSFAGVGAPSMAVILDRRIVGGAVLDSGTPGEGSRLRPFSCGAGGSSAPLPPLVLLRGADIRREIQTVRRDIRA